jgi:hypothetical protein
MVEARNSIGYSALSNRFSILAATYPDPTDPPTTSRVLNYIVVDWNPPTNSNGAAVLSYKIFILQSDGSTWT